MSLVLALDQGTTSSRAIVFDDRAEIVAVAQEEFEQLYPHPGWVEHNPEAIWASTLGSARRALADAEAKTGRQVQAIGITNQRETALIWERESLRPIANAIVWQDRRTSAVCARLKDDGAEPTVQAKTGLVLDPYFSATKFAWMLDQAPGARDRAARGELAFGTVDAYLLARLTGVHATDATNASRTSLYNIHTNVWDEELLALFNVPVAGLPDVRDCMADFGATPPALFGRSLPVFSMIGDQQAAAVGQACFAPGEVKSTYGTGCFIIAQTGERAVQSHNRLLTTIARRIEGRTYYGLEGSIFIAGAAVQWLRDSLGVIGTAAETEALARSIPDTKGVYLVPAFAGLGAPHWAAEARGLITGLTRGAGRAEIARAALESVAYQTADLLEAMAKDGAPVTTLKVDGGMVANDWLLQFLADVLASPVERPRVLETTALGAAALAGVQAGVYASLDAVAELRRVQRLFEPAMPADHRGALQAGWRDALARALAAPAS